MRRHAATALVLALLIGTAVAFAETERLKLKPTPIEESFVQPAFSPACGCKTSRAQIRIRLHRADTVTVRVVDESDRAIRVILDQRRLPRGRAELTWGGRARGDMLAPDGRYRIEVDLEGADRTFELPQVVSLDTVSPTVRLVSAPDRVGVGHRVRISYRVNEPAHAILYVNGVKRAGPTYTKRRAAQIQWRPRRPGRYRLQLAAVDPAGNLGPHSPVFTVLVA
jgi:hypothetical protein